VGGIYKLGLRPRGGISQVREYYAVKMYQISNIYGITAIAVIGGGLFGFDISSMSAM
jgi:hypothetical protein